MLRVSTVHVSTGINTFFAEFVDHNISSFVKYFILRKVNIAKKKIY